MSIWGTKKWAWARVGLAALAALLVLGCGGSGKDAKSAEPAKASSTQGDDESKVRPALVKAPAPEGIVIRFRARNIAGFIDGMFEAASIPFNWRDALASDPEAFPYLQALDLNGTSEGLVVMNKRNPLRPFTILSMGVSSVEAVVQLLKTKRIESREGPDGVFFFMIEGESCAVGPAISGSAARVACSADSASLNELLPYALRGMPQEELSKSDLFLQFDMTPIREIYGKEFKAYLRWAPAYARTLHTGDPVYDRALSDAANVLAAEGAALIDELGTVTAEAHQSSGDVSAKLTATFIGDGSTTVSILKDLALKQGRTPAIFDAIPSTASAAGFSNEVSKERVAAWVSIAADLIQGTLEREGMSTKYSQRVGGLVRDLGPTGGAQSFARGPLVRSMVDGKSLVHPAWVLSGTTREKSDVLATVDDLAWLLGSSETKKLFPDVPSFPKVTKSNTKLPGIPQATVYEWRLPPELLLAARLVSTQLPAGWESEDVMGAITKMSSGLFAVHEVGGNTWMTWGHSPDELAEAFRAVATTDGQMLGDLGGLNGVRSEPAVGAGYARIEALVGMVSWILPEGTIKDWEGLEAAMPHRGATPLTYFFKAKPGATTEASWEVRVPAEFTQDLVALTLMLAVDSKLRLGRGAD